MGRNLDCPNAVQKNVEDRIMCKLGGGCSHQHPCGLIGGIALSYGHYSCPGRNKIPPSPEKKIYPKSVSRKKRRQLEEKEKRKNI